MTEDVKKYYGEILQSSTDLQTNACSCATDKISPEVKAALSEIHTEIKDRFYGCGSPIPPLLEGKTVLDLGCGTGRDVYIISKLVGSSGQVIGVDMTVEQLEVANRHVDYQTKQFGYDKPNVVFKQGYIEDLKEIGIADNSVDVVISNCVINLSPDKSAVFKEIFRVLKPGGELYFSDVFANRRLPQALAKDKVLHSECLGGALYTEDFRRLLREAGCNDYRITSASPITVNNPEIEDKVGLIEFTSLTIRAFKLELEDICEDYGQVAIYKGTIPNAANYIELDDHHKFIAHKPMLVCGNTADMIQHTRFGEHFEVWGNKNTHFGAFDCGTTSSVNATANSCGCKNKNI